MNIQFTNPSFVVSLPYIITLEDHSSGGPYLIE
jgi:hypothetical protein